MQKLDRPGLKLLHVSALVDEGMDARLDAYRKQNQLSRFLRAAMTLGMPICKAHHDVVSTLEGQL
jgi:hypothetical protein